LDLGPPSRCKRTIRWWRAASAAALACLLMVAAARPAAATVTIGQLPPTTPSPTCSSSSTDYLEPSVTGGTLYIARQAGTITSFSTRSFGPGATYTLKIFRRTMDPDVFQVVAHAPPHMLTAGLNTFIVSVPVRSGDLLGLNASGVSNSCTFPSVGDLVLLNPGDIPDGGSDKFTAQTDSRLNLSAVLDPSNGFTLDITRDRRLGTATVTAQVPNPGVVTLLGKGLKSGRAAKSAFGAGPVPFQVSAIGKWKRRLLRKGRVNIGASITFLPTGGDPSTQQITLRLKKKRTPLSI
jgi:hypothetical protein